MCSPAGAKQLPQAGNPDNCQGDAEVEVRDEIGAKTNAGEKERREYVGDDGVDVLRRSFSQMSGFTDGNPGNESTKDGMDSRKFRESCTGKSERENKT